MLKLYRFLRPYRLAVVAILALTLLQVLSELMLPTLMADIVDEGVLTGNTAIIWSMGVRMLGVAALGVMFSVAASYYAARTSSAFGRDIRQAVFRRTQSFSLQEFDKFGTATLITRTTNDITQVQMVTMMILRMMLMTPMMAIGGIIMAVRQDARLSLIIVFVVPVLGAAIGFIAAKGMPMFKALQEKLDKLNLVSREGLTGVRVIRAFNRTQHEAERFRAANHDLTDTAIRVNKLMALLMPLMMLVLSFTNIAIIWFGGIRIEAGDLQIGNLMAFLQYIMQIMWSLIMLTMMFVMIPRASVSATRINEILETEPVITDGDGAAAGAAAGAEPATVEFRDVTFSYPGAEEPALRNISFRAGPGEVTAIIGSLGAGKTTLINLIPRFYDVTSGQVLVGGKDVRDWPQAELRAKIGLVPQRAVLFSGTVAENIRYGNEHAPDDAVRHAAAVAQADFVEGLEGGFDASVSQGGTNLSGGQRQRLTIARAIVRRPEIYLFDDNFSALDFKTDARLRAALREETAGATVIIVAQRVSTIMDADRILVLDEGRLVGNGTHSELLETCQVYREIVASQLGEEVSA